MSKEIKWSLVEVLASDLKPNPKNPKVRDKKGFERLQKSLERFGHVFDGIANKDMSLIDGHSRLELAEPNSKLRVFVPSRQLSEKEYLEMNAIFDLAKAGEIDLQILEEQFTEEFFEEWGMKEEKPESQEDNFEIQEEIKTDIVLGDLFEIGEHRLLCGDSTDKVSVGRLMNGEKAQMVFTDPPYRVSFEGQRISNTTRDGTTIHGHKGANTKHGEIENDDLSDHDFMVFMECVLANIFLFNNGAWYICFAYSELHLLLNSLLSLGHKWKNIIIWMKNQATLSNMDYKSRYEPILYGQPGGRFYGERYKQEDIWQFQRTLKNDLHPTMKPIPLIENALTNSSKVKDIVLDLFLGSGSTMVAAHQLNRKCYGMEIDPKYCQVIVDRMRALDPEIKVLKNGKPI